VLPRKKHWAQRPAKAEFRRMEASLLGYFSHRGRERALACVDIPGHAMPAAGVAGHHHAASQQAQRTAVGKHRRGHRARLRRQKTVTH